MKALSPLKTWLALALLWPAGLWACIQLDDSAGPDTATKTGGNNHMAKELRRAMAVDPKSLTARSKFGAPRSDLAKQQAAAVDKIFAGDQDAAIELLTTMEKRDPGRYSTAAILGTAYELKGDNENALKWINEGIRRNSKAYQGTEWLHAYVLRSKIERARDPGVPFRTRLLWVPEKLNFDDVLLLKGEPKRSVEDVRKALAYQLAERMTFVKPHDPYVAELLYSYALIESSLSAVENALGLLQLAREYGFPDEKLLATQVHRFRDVEDNSWAKQLAVTLLIMVVLMQVGMYCWRRQDFFQAYFKGTGRKPVG